MSVNIGAIASNPPFALIVSRNCMSAALASVLRRLANFSTSMPAILANLAGSWNIAVISWLNTVADVAASCPFWSSAEARPMSCV